MMSPGLTALTICDLPGGLMLDDGQMVERVELRPLTGREEDWLAKSAGVQSAAAVTALLSHCVVHAGGVQPGRDFAGSLLVGDRDFLMLQLRRLTLGDRIQAVLQCPECASKVDVDFLASEVPVERAPQRTSVYAVEFDHRTVNFRLPNGHDQDAVRLLDVTEAVDLLLSRCLLDTGRETLSQEERELVIETMEQNAPRVELELSVQCPECSHEFLVPFDTTAFFLQEIRMKQEQLLREVHTLALHYHWSEAEILGLERSRRRVYLELLADAVRGDR